MERCTICGMRPYKMPAGVRRDLLLAALETAIRGQIGAGRLAFQTGLAMGTDLWGAGIVLRLKAEYPDLRLIGFQPCRTQAARWPADWKRFYQDIIAQADEIHCLQEMYTDGCMLRRNRRMVEEAASLIAVHDGRSTGGTLQTIRYARQRGLQVILVNPLDYIEEL